jgi:hypothetical protein
MDRMEEWQLGSACKFTTNHRASILRGVSRCGYSVATVWLKYGALHAYHGTVGQANHDYHTELEVNNIKLLRLSICIIPWQKSPFFISFFSVWILSLRDVVNWEYLESFPQS